MKTTGVVRRIDELGRIVIPKEIRRSLHIRDGESLEIFVDKDMIGLKKYSSMNDLEEISFALSESIYKALNVTVLIMDRDEIIACSGPLKKKYQGKRISRFLEDSIVQKKELNSIHRSKVEISEGMIEDGFFYGEFIVVNGDSIGEVVVYEPDKSISETERHIVTIVTQFLTKHLEQ